MDTELVLLLLPLILLQVALQIMALYDLYQRKAVRSLTILAWVIIIIVFNLLGPVVYFVLGRSDVDRDEESDFE